MSGHEPIALNLNQRRQIVFAAAVGIAGLSISLLCLVPLFIRDVATKSLFADLLQESFFFDIVGWIGGCWLLSWVSALSQWRKMARLGQWLGIVLLCLDQVVLLAVWKALSLCHNNSIDGLWLAPALLQACFLGYFFGFFTMPALTLSGNRTLTGLGALAVLLPWLLGRQAIILGTQYLCGYYF
ncbi:MAG: hypothetical protein HY711_08685 [Candidatus Melainabacteria bacterium]|nr:hypothetical protein [Candidatus Melainabacteria bacterium]